MPGRIKKSKIINKGEHHTTFVPARQQVKIFGASPYYIVKEGKRKTMENNYKGGLK